MLVVTWAVICSFTGGFFWMVLRTPPRPDDEDPTTDGILRKDA
jgi:hypothetical protein